MNLTAFQALLSPSGQQALRAAEALAPRENDFLPHLTSLCRQYPKELASAALETAILRLEAAQMYFSGTARSAYGLGKELPHNPLPPLSPHNS